VAWGRCANESSRYIMFHCGVIGMWEHALIYLVRNTIARIPCSVR
jgi:hypothetical protein